MADTLLGRLGRILPDGKGVWIPMDHGASSFPINGLVDTDAAVDAAISGGADAIVMQKGLVSHHSSRNGWDGYVCHVSVSTVHGGSRSQDKVSVASAEECQSRGAVAVSAQVNMGDDSESDMIERMGQLTSQALDAEMPVLGMIYPRGPNLVVDEDDTTGGVAHAVRLAWELGCHVAKVPWTGSADSFSRVVEAAPIPVLIAGGPMGGDFEGILSTVEEAMSVGCAGVCMGRQVFGSEDPESRVKALRAVVHEGIPASEASLLLR
ncbi:MAG: 2-amino-3,7-dideoxy-D-threo-hept-6-ulosonate synthase [Candidatus Thalassarchaeaceae archaeon]|nr:2-amino-3,7-dideoxy-D-threo-hept-6-ulosonate synthase [Candidatus Thalassarchaeaceae archaeon]